LQLRPDVGALEHLVVLGLLENNPGHGHPLRPEFKLTDRGATIAEWAAELDSIAKSDVEKALLRNKWSLPLVSCIPDEVRYSEIRRRLVPVTDRALSAGLGRLTDNRWIQRNVSGNISPPVVSYRTLRTGKKIHNHLLSLSG